MSLTDDGGLAEGVSLDSVENYVVDLKGGHIVGTTGSSYFATGGFRKNRGALNWVWRGDGKALLVEEQARFGSAIVVRIQIFPGRSPEYPRVEVVAIDSAMERVAVEMLKKDKDLPEEALGSYLFNFTPERWDGQTKMIFRMLAQVPEGVDDPVYEEVLRFSMPETIVNLEE
ncbi:hypothetical protein [Luteolibacter sp. AS25]|uniref:hypothetical protein n=1 Tax=Luteolibacter sp. AS25 TaxID=3135776 RepID=UPI00398B7A10